MVNEFETWAMRGLLALLASAVAYFLIREFNRKDGIEKDLKGLAEKVTVSIEELNKGVGALTLAIEEIRLWSTERFVPWPAHREAIEGVKEDIRIHAERFERELERCEARCPQRSK